MDCTSKAAGLDEVLDNGASFYCFVTTHQPACKKHATEYAEDVVLITDCEYKSEWNGDWMTDEWIEITDAEPGPEFHLHESDITPDLFVEDGIRTCPRCESEYGIGVGIQGPPSDRYFECPNCSKLLDPTNSEIV